MFQDDLGFGTTSYVTLLTQRILHSEQDEIKALNPSKAFGPDGIPC